MSELNSTDRNINWQLILESKLAIQIGIIQKYSTLNIDQYNHEKDSKIHLELNMFPSGERSLLCLYIYLSTIYKKYI